MLAGRAPGVGKWAHAGSHGYKWRVLLCVHLAPAFTLEEFEEEANAVWFETEPPLLKPTGVVCAFSAPVSPSVGWF